MMLLLCEQAVIHTRMAIDPHCLQRFIDHNDGNLIYGDIDSTGEDDGFQAVACLNYDRDWGS